MIGNKMLSWVKRNVVARSNAVLSERAVFGFEFLKFFSMNCRSMPIPGRFQIAWEIQSMYTGDVSHFAHQIQTGFTFFNC